MNIEEGNNGIRACVLCPGEVETPILDHRPIPVPKEERERLIQSEDMGEIVVFIMKLPARVTLNEVIISPTYTRPLQPVKKLMRAIIEEAEADPQAWLNDIESRSEIKRTLCGTDIWYGIFGVRGADCFPAWRSRRLEPLVPQRGRNYAQRF